MVNPFSCYREVSWSSDHPPLLSSMDAQAFLCCGAHQGILFFSQNEPNCWFGHSECSCYLSGGFVLFLKPNNCLFYLHRELLWLHDVGSQQQLPNANVTLRIKSTPFTCLIDEIRRNSPHMSMKWLLSQLSNYIWSLQKKGGYILKSCNSLTFPPILMRISSNSKAQSVHFKPIFII